MLVGKKLLPGPEELHGSEICGSQSVASLLDVFPSPAMQGTSPEHYSLRNEIGLDLCWEMSALHLIPLL